MKRIVIAEDDPPSAELMCDFLTAHQYDVTLAFDGAEAVRKIEQVSPDLILLDIQMPVLDGFAVLRWLKNQPGLSAIPVAALTAYAMRGDSERILNAGFDAHIPKPVDVAALPGQLQSLLNRALSNSLR
ncbi:MAG: response regulator [Acidobacteria bacterium]|nr:response regulator [Acidobacteriota bacterium]